MALAPKPIVLTSQTAASYPASLPDPQPFVVVQGATAGSVVAVTKQAGIADIPAATLPADFAGVQTQIQTDRTKINAIISALEAAGILVTV